MKSLSGGVLKGLAPQFQLGTFGLSQFHVGHYSVVLRLGDLWTLEFRFFKGIADLGDVLYLRFECWEEFRIFHPGPGCEMLQCKSGPGWT